MTTDELRAAAEYCRDRDGYAFSSGPTADVEFIDKAKAVAAAWLAAPDPAPDAPGREVAELWTQPGLAGWWRVPATEEQPMDPNASEWPSIADAKGLAYQYRRRGVMVLSFSAEGQAGASSYGMTRRDCDAMGRFLNRVMELIDNGTLPRPW